MTRQIVTQQAVFEAAAALTAEGVEPTTVNLQARIGAGSYTTVQKYFVEWKKQQANAATSAQQVPPEVQTKGQEFVRSLWTLATLEAQAEVQQAKEAARVEVGALGAELAEARSVIERLEEREESQAQAIEKQAAKLREVELALTEAQTQALRVADLEKSLAELRTERELALAALRAELDASRKEATERAVEAGKLAGEAEALRRQVQQLMEAIQPKPKKGADSRATPDQQR